MPVEAPSKVKVEDFALASHDKLTAVNEQFFYSCSPAMAEEDAKPYMHEPVSALPPAVRSQLPPRVEVMLVPYLEQANGKNGVRVSYELVELPLQVAVHRIHGKEAATILFAIQDLDVSEYHYTFYNEIAVMVARAWPVQAREIFMEIVKGELTDKVNGEVDEKSWALKQNLLRRSGAREKAFKEYGRQAFEDTLTLYLHGICCDIDVETGPRQMPSRYVRKRLQALHVLFPPPSGHAVFPEELNRIAKR